MIDIPAPMLATAGELPGDDTGWRYEFKWDGIRLVVAWDDDELRAVTRNGNDVTVAWPEIGPLGAQLGEGPTVVDGEVVVLDGGGRPDFGLLQTRMHLRDPAAVARAAAERPATYLVFDLLMLDGHDLTGLALTSRREVLEGLELDGAHWAVPPALDGNGAATLEAARRLGLEGVVAKRADSPYWSGVRSPAWRKIKILRRDDFLVCGYTPGTGRREGTFGALVLGARNGDTGELVHVGSVGTGFDDAELERLGDRLVGLISPCPFPAPPAVDAVYVRPVTVCEVRYSGWTRDGMLRHPSYVALRDDKPADDVVLPAP